MHLLAHSAVGRVRFPFGCQGSGPGMSGQAREDQRTNMTLPMAQGLSGPDASSQLHLGPLLYLRRAGPASVMAPSTQLILFLF